MLASIFPNLTFYSAVGNHEAGRDIPPSLLSRNTIFSKAPVNLFPPPNVKSDNISWLYETLAENWIKLGLPEDTRASIEREAFYSTVVLPGLRLISLNMNYCSRENFWLMINATDPLDQLQWVFLDFSNEIV